MEPGRGGPNFSFAGFLLLAIMGTFLWKSIPLESSRPTENYGRSGPAPVDNQLPARLWQDPFRQVIEVSDNRKRSIPDCRLDVLNTSIEQKHVRVMAVMLTAGPDAELAERRRRRRYAVVSGLGAAGLVPKSASTIGFCYLQKEMPNKLENKYIAPYEWYIPDPTDTPTGESYAVLVLWVNETIFAREPMGRFANVAEQVAGLRKSNQTEINTRFFVLGPASSDTLRRLARRASEEQEGDEMRQLKQRFSGLAIDGLHILSPVATVSREQFTADDKQKSRLDRLAEAFAPRSCMRKSVASAPCVSFLRTIPADDRLAELLAKELLDSGRPWVAGKARIVLVSEWDTQFGRSLPRAFKAAYSRETAGRKGASSPEILEYSYLRGIDGRFAGGDEDGSGDGTGSMKNEKTLNEDLFEGQDKRVVRRPVGAAQFDYLRRIADKIRATNEALEAEGNGRVAAIGVLGSDVYDKLLILRALRPQFPQTLFFTTDLDAQLLHPADFRWTRNLIVASSFGLELRPDLQGTIPPFRGNYQTSVFLSTLLATRFNYPYVAGAKAPDVSTYETFMQSVPPLLFEVGRNGAQRLDRLPGNVDTVQPPATRTSLTRNTLYLFLIAVLLVVGVHQIKPFSGWLVFWSALALMVGLGLACVAIVSSYRGEPVSLTSGTSIWPTEFIRYGALCLSIYFISLLLLDLRANCARISRDMLNIDPELFRKGTGLTPVLARPVTVEDLWKHHGKWLFGGLGFSGLILVFSFIMLGFGKESVWVPGAFLVMIGVTSAILLVLACRRVRWIARCIPAVLVVMVGMPLTEFMGAQHAWAPPAYWVMALSLWFYLIYKRYPAADRVDSVNNWVNNTAKMAKSDDLDARNYWMSYCRLGQPKGRWYRSLSVWLLFMAFGSLIFSVSGFPVTPCRGGLSCGLDKALVIASVSAMLLLIFLVLDEFRLTIYWIKGLTNYKRMNWSGVGGKGCEGLGDQIRDLAHERLKISLIAERTEEIGRLIYYPFLIIIVILVSRSSYFDNWGLPQGIAIVVAINILLLIVAGMKVRYEAEKCRGETLKLVEARLIERLGDGSPGGKLDVAQTRQLRDDIREIREGAFQRFTDQPLLRASLLLLGAIGMTAGEYLRIFS